MKNDKISALASLQERGNAGHTETMGPATEVRPDVPPDVWASTVDRGQKRLGPENLDATAKKAV